MLAVQLVEHKELGQKNARQHMKRFVAPQALRDLLAPTLPLQSQLHLRTPVNARDTSAWAVSVAVGQPDAPAGGRSDRAVAAHAAGGGANPDNGAATAGEEPAEQPVATGGNTGTAADATGSVRMGVPMATGVLREKRLALIAKRVAEAGFLLHNEIRYVWYTAMTEVRHVSFD